MRESTYQTGINNSVDKEDIIFISQQPDDLRMVETLKYFDYEPQRSNLLQAISDTIKAETNSRILEKFQWIAEYHGIDLAEPDAE